tara:strand:+ start:574 stop:825 length:252 start_codon:yes stop_codon:yes gene_type:complete
MAYTITLTDTQIKALEYVAKDPKEWITNAAEARAQRATAEIITKLTAHCNEKSIALAVGEAAQVTQAYDLGVIKKYGSETSTK